MEQEQDDVDRLLRLLVQAEARLREQGHAHWADWLRRDGALIARGDAYGLRHLLGAFGGMGSINDLMDDKLRPLLSQIYTITTDILRELD